MDVIIELANSMKLLKMYPYFDLAHAILTCMTIRESISSDFYSFSRKHPLSSWVSCMLTISAGTILTNFLLAQPILSAFRNTDNLILSTVVWYLIFYSPSDIVYNICNYLPIKLVIVAIKEVRRCNRVYSGVIEAHKLYPNNFLIMIIIGTIKGNGSGFMKVIAQLIRGVWNPAVIEFLSPTFSTKASIFASVIFILELNGFISVAHSLIYLSIILFFVSIKISSMLSRIEDPFVPIENLFCAIFFEGIVWREVKKSKIK